MSDMITRGGVWRFGHPDRYYTGIHFQEGIYILAAANKVDENLHGMDVGMMAGSDVEVERKSIGFREFEPYDSMERNEETRLRYRHLSEISSRNDRCGAFTRRPLIGLAVSEVKGSRNAEKAHIPSILCETPPRQNQNIGFLVSIIHFAGCSGRTDHVRAKAKYLDDHSLPPYLIASLLSPWRWRDLRSIYKCSEEHPRRQQEQRRN